MTRKHFVALAKIMRQHHPGRYQWGTSPNLWESIQKDLANLCAESNDSFDGSRFENACYPLEDK